MEFVSKLTVLIYDISLNLNTYLANFGKIIPCGIRNKDVTSIQRELGKEINMDEVKGKLLGHFADIFGMEFEPASI